MHACAAVHACMHVIRTPLTSYRSTASKCMLHNGICHHVYNLYSKNCVHGLFGTTMGGGHTTLFLAMHACVRCVTLCPRILTMIPMAISKGHSVAFIAIKQIPVNLAAMHLHANMSGVETLFRPLLVRFSIGQCCQGHTKQHIAACGKEEGQTGISHRPSILHATR